MGAASGGDDPLDWARAEPVPALLTLAWGPLLVAAAACASWRLRRRPRELALLLALPVYGLLVHVPLHAEPRYFMPFVGILLALSAIGLAGPPDASPRRGSDSGMIGSRTGVPS